MDVSTLAQGVAALISPFLPYLLKSAEGAMGEVGKGVGGDAWKGAKAVWNKIFPKIENKPAAIEAAHDLAGDLKSQEAQNALVWQLKKVFDADQSFAEEVKLLLEQSETSGEKIRIDRNVRIAAPVSDTVIIAGDQNRVKKE